MARPLVLVDGLALLLEHLNVVQVLVRCAAQAICFLLFAFLSHGTILLLPQSWQASHVDRRYGELFAALA